MLSWYPSPTFRAIDRRRVKCVAVSITWRNPCRQHGWLGPCVSFLCCNGKENSKERAHTHTPKLNIYRLWMMVNHVFCFVPSFFFQNISGKCPGLRSPLNLFATWLLRGETSWKMLITSLLLLGKKGTNHIIFSQLSIDLTWSPTVFESKTAHLSRPRSQGCLAQLDETGRSEVCIYDMMKNL